MTVLQIAIPVLSPFRAPHSVECEHGTLRLVTKDPLGGDMPKVSFERSGYHRVVDPGISLYPPR